MRLPSEKPNEGEEVLIRVKDGGPYFLLAEFYEGDGTEPKWYSEEVSIATEDVIGWWPLPKIEGAE